MCQSRWKSIAFETLVTASLQDFFLGEPSPNNLNMLQLKCQVMGTIGILLCTYSCCFVDCVML